MKFKTLLTFVLICFATSQFVFAQSSKVESQKQTENKTSDKYVCPNCSLVANAAGNCTFCQMKTCKVGDFYCIHCGTVPADSGKCVYCTNKLVEMRLPDPNKKIVRESNPSPAK
ncbi:MAG: hypothetical protein IPP29_15885 [Bacteroidetes bacterium]|nr:hypothetical protein [Bacteroidota bacterium]